MITIKIPFLFFQSYFSSSKFEIVFKKIKKKKIITVLSSRWKKVRVMFCIISEVYLTNTSAAEISLTKSEIISTAGETNTDKQEVSNVYASSMTSQF